MRKESASRKSLYLVLVIMVVLMGTRIGGVDCRALREAPDAIIADKVDRAETTGMVSFAVSSNNSTSRGSSLTRSLAFNLASGPSKKGPGH
ncbi:hypothetical protein Acr_04g0007720 [Actinidia rufa]|uniref:Uncharacterized protein n=1 Tax=Actinidia rufa TaxID=165716 RepID=A0A7J0EHS7_9ERIC|nr:hypothetical protein Acr_04g0007720 [Actinidia rufa]